MPREKLVRMEEAGPHILVAKLIRMLGKSDTSQLLIHNWCPHAFVLPSLGQRRCRHVRENNSVRPRIVSALFQWLKLIVSVDTI